MADVLTDVSMASMVHAVEANLFSFFPLLAKWPRAEAHDDPDMIWTLSDAPFPLFNSVLRANFEQSGIEAGIEKAVARCRERQVPMLWWTGPSTKPSGLDRALTEYGFFEDQATGMAADLKTVGHGGHGAFGGHGEFTFEPVSRKSTLSEWCRVLCEGFGAPPLFGDAFGEFAQTVGLVAPSPLRHFLGRVDGEAVATCSIFTAAGVAGIYDVTTLPEWRRRGIGAAITFAALDEARAQGFRVAILHSSALGVNVYRSLGFQECCRIGQYVWIP